jgi:hypothetical protein
VVAMAECEVGTDVAERTVEPVRVGIREHGGIVIGGGLAEHHL